MPFVENQEAKIYWDEQGHGPPVLLIMGLGYPSVMWYRTRPVLAPRYRTIVLDNRGVGRSGMPPGPYPIARMHEDLAMRRPWFPRPEAYQAQLQGIIAWEAYSRLPQITAPTLVIHGESDRLVPSGNGKLIAERIPGTKLVLIPNAGHIFPTDQPEAAHQAVLEFLDAQARPDRQEQPETPTAYKTEKRVY